MSRNWYLIGHDVIKKLEELVVINVVNDQNVKKSPPVSLDALQV